MRKRFLVLIGTAASFFAVLVPTAEAHEVGNYGCNEKSGFYPSGWATGVDPDKNGDGIACYNPPEHNEGYRYRDNHVH
jgi:hypothetical protein